MSLVAILDFYHQNNSSALHQKLFCNFCEILYCQPGEEICLSQFEAVVVTFEFLSVNTVTKLGLHLTNTSNISTMFCPILNSQSYVEKIFKMSQQIRGFGVIIWFLLKLWKPLKKFVVGHLIDYPCFNWYWESSLTNWKRNWSIIWVQLPLFTGEESYCHNLIFAIYDWKRSQSVTD